ncbi:MAG: hypothetical protein QM755_20290 [Luteolibacter sp.]
MDRFTSDWGKFLFLNGPQLVFCDLSAIVDRASPVKLDSKTSYQEPPLPLDSGVWLVSNETSGRLDPLEGLIHSSELPLSRSPETIVCWKRKERPWKKDQGGVQGSGLWDSEKTSWECLRMGQWEKPLILEIEPGNLARAVDLAERGWKVLIEDRRGVLKKAAPALPDLEVLQALPSEKVRSEVIRFGSSPEGPEPGLLEGVASWLKRTNYHPSHVILGGPVSTGEVKKLKARGYTQVATLEQGTWQKGGQDPTTLDYRSFEPMGDAERDDDTLFVGAGWDAYFLHDKSGFPTNEPAPADGDVVIRKSRIGESVADDAVAPSRQLSARASAWRQQLDENGHVSQTIRPINIVLHGDHTLMIPMAVTIHSIVRRTRHPVHVRCYFRGEPPEDFHAANLLVEFVKICPSKIAASAASYDNLEILQDHPHEWDRCWLFDSDHLMMADPASIYFNDMEGHLVMASTIGIKLGTCWNINDPSRESEIYSPCSILNLEETRRVDTWRKIDELRAFQNNGHYSFVVATGGALRVLPQRWGRSVYVNDIDNDYRELFPDVLRPEKDWFENFGLLNFSYGPKPWTTGGISPSDPRVRERIWFKEYSTWDKLRDGDWCPPDGCSILPLGIEAI